MEELPIGCRSSFCQKLPIFSACLLAFCLSSVVSQQSESPVTFDALYVAGKEAYEHEEWFVCANHMDQAIRGYNDFVESLTRCRRGCREKNAGMGRASGESLELAFFEMTLKRANCIARCRREKVKEPSQEIFTEDVMAAFKSLKPYDYLQICAYKVGKYETAVAAAYTYLLAHPEHQSMKDNVKFYRSMREVKTSYFKNLESKPHQDLYKEGVEAYNEADYLTTIEVLERALSTYYEEAEKCESLCESAVENKVSPDLYMAVADHWMPVLACRLQCPVKLATEFGQLLPDYLAEQYNYLQYAYYKVGDLKKAAEKVASFLLYKPNDAVMLENKVFYLSQDGVTEGDFQPGKVADAYYRQNEVNAEMMKYIKHKATAAAKGDLDDLETPMKNSNAVPLDAALFGPHDAQYHEKMKDLKRHLRANIAAEERELNGAHRVAVDNLLTQPECEALVELAGRGALTGDGYKGAERQRSSPHTDYEMFEGLTIQRAAELVKLGTISDSAARLYLKASESARNFLATYYNVRQPLYFHFTHLVCRTALQDKNHKNRDDLSHPVHSDNCFIQPDGSCLKEKPAYIWRDLTGLIYLNDDFEGGDFFWAHRNMSVQTTVRPKCGRLVGFEASDYHGVMAVKRGRRCAVAMWYTFSPEYEEKTHSKALDLLDELHLQTGSQQTWNKSLEVLSQERSYNVTLTESQLNGTERFVADHVATKEDCRILKELVNNNGVLGDGYESKDESPLTPHEHFMGLTVTRAVKVGGMQGDGYPDRGGRRDISPHTAYETFSGVTVLRAAELARDHVVSIASVESYLDLSDFARDLVRAYFDLRQPLYHDFTHLVCRTAVNGRLNVPDSNMDRSDMSHPIHSDNCAIQPDGSCVREPPAYIERDYSAILYLNDDFEGGEFIFAHRNLSTQLEIKPTLGRLVGFNASHFHGVKAVLSGQRCAIALWFTFDPRYSEAGHDLARNIINELKRKAEGPATAQSHEEL